MKGNTVAGVEELAVVCAGRGVMFNDLARCTWLDRYRVVPEVEDRVIRVPPTSGKTWKGHR